MLLFFWLVGVGTGFIPEALPDGTLQFYSGLGPALRLNFSMVGLAPWNGTLAPAMRVWASATGPPGGQARNIKSVLKKKKVTSFVVQQAMLVTQCSRIWGSRKRPNYILFRDFHALANQWSGFCWVVWFFPPLKQEVPLNLITWVCVVPCNALYLIQIVLLLCTKY